MNLPFERVFRLVSRGGAGISCDETGIALGGVPLVRVSSTSASLQSEIRPLKELGEVLRLAYGPQSPDVVLRCHRGLVRAAGRLAAGDLAGAGIEAISIGLPDLSPQTSARLARLGELEKAGTAWQNEPRVPAGQSDGGQWTAGGGPASVDGPGSQAATNGNARPSRQVREPLSADDGVYRPNVDRPAQLLTGGTDDAEGFRHGIGGNEPPYDFTELSDLFPGLRNEPGVAIPLAPLDSFLGISGVANQANLAASEAEYDKLLDQIHNIDPNFRHDELQSLASMSWEGRANAINTLLFERAVVLYRVRGEIGPLQVETLRFLRAEVDRAYAQAVQEYDNGKLEAPATRQLAIGNRVDVLVRRELQDIFNVYGIRYGPGQNIIVNNRDVSSEDQSYRRPDARLGNVSFDWSLVFKTLSDAQLRGFLRADSQPDTIVILRPSRLPGLTTYAIARPSGHIRKVQPYGPSVQTTHSEHSRRTARYDDLYAALLADIRRYLGLFPRARRREELLRLQRRSSPSSPAAR